MSPDCVLGYTVWGEPPAQDPIDGAVVPCTAAGSLPFLLKALQTSYGSSGAWGRYGLADAFHPSANWFCPDVLGIDLGISILMDENLRTLYAVRCNQCSPRRSAFTLSGLAGSG